MVGIIFTYFHELVSQAYTLQFNPQRQILNFCEVCLFFVVEIFAVVLLILKAFDCEGEHNCELFASILILKLAVDIYLALKIFTSVRNC